MEVSDQFHGLDASSLWKSPKYLIHMRLSGSRASLNTLEKRQILLLLQEIEFQFFSGPAHNLVNIQTPQNKN
jgi:hypothetical protein